MRSPFAPFAAASYHATVAARASLPGHGNASRREKRLREHSSVAQALARMSPFAIDTWRHLRASIG